MHFMVTPVSSARKALWACRAIATALAGVIVFAETISTAISGKVAYFLINAYYMFRLEFVMIVLGVIVGPLFVSAIKKAYASYRLAQGNRDAMPVAFRWARIIAWASIVICVVSLGVLAVYVSEKVTFVRSFPSFLLNKGLKEYRRGNINRADLMFSSCADLLGDADCATERDQLAERLMRAASLRRIHDSLNAANSSRPALQDTILSLDRQFAWHERHRQMYIEELERHRKSYRRGIELLKGGRIREAEKIFHAINRSAPGFGSVHIMLSELASGASQTPLLEAVRSRPTTEFVALMTDWREPRHLTENARSEIVYAAAAGQPLPAQTDPTREVFARILGF
jgi:hypothetical protein